MQKMTIESSALYVVATPLGNLADLSPRAQEVLRGVGWIAAEDTRHTQGLLSHFAISARLLAAHEHNERQAAGQIIDKLTAGESVALVSDAGTPAVSDPGAKVVEAVRAAGFKVIPIPGPSAAVTALSAAGLADARWLFVGFLPAKAGERRRELEALKAVDAALVFYEAPHRIVDMVADLAATLEPARPLVIARELTKTFEQIHACPLADGPAWLAEDPNHQRGEFVVIVGAAPAAVEEGLPAEAERALVLLLDEGLPVKQAAKLAAALTGSAKNALYARALELKDGAA